MGSSAFVVRGEQLIPLLERKRLLDGAWVVCLMAALAGVSSLWFLSILHIDLTRVAWPVFAYAVIYLVASTLTDRLDSPRAVAWAMRAMMVASVIFLGVFWHLVGGLRYPMFLAAFAIPVMISGIMTVGLPGYFVALLSIAVAATVAAGESPGLRWYLQQMHVPVPDVLAVIADETAGRPSVFPGVIVEPAYEFALIATFSFMQLILAFVSTPLTALLLRINHRFETSKKLLGEVQGLFHAILRAEPDPAVIVYGDSNQIVQASDTFFQRMMVKPSQLAGKGLFEVIAFERPEDVRMSLQPRHGTVPFCVYKVGPETRIANLSFHRTEHGGVEYQYVAWKELTDVYHLQAAFNGMHEPLLVVSVTGTILYINSAARMLFESLALGTECSAVPELQALLAGPDTVPADDQDPRCVIQGRPFAVNRSTAQLPGGGDACTILWLRSLAREEALFAQAVRDSLTGIHNRRYFDEVMGGLVDRTHRGHALTLAYFDLDDFKGINDKLGHAAGDAALRFFVHAVQTELRETDIFARRGGDEFAVLFVDCDVDVAGAAIERVRTRLKNHKCAFEEHVFQVKFSAGLAACHAGDTVDMVLDRADRALYQVKHGGKGGLEVAR
jgi:diguanylate cyclase (GGDEF)-like protein